MEEIIIDDLVSEKKNISNNNATKQWDKCCFYIGTLSVIFTIGTVIIIVVVKTLT